MDKGYLITNCSLLGAQPVNICIIVVERDAIFPNLLGFPTLGISI